MKSINYIKKNISLDIVSRNNEKLKQLRKLKEKSYREKQNLFFIEGSKLFDEAVKSKLKFHQIFLTESWLMSKGETSLAGLEKVPVYQIKDTLMDSVSFMKKPEGILCVLEKLQLKPNNPKRFLLLEDIQDPNNFGTLIRTADAFGIDLIVTTEKTADLYNEKVLRGSMGSVFHIPVIQVSSLKEYVLSLKQQSVKILGSSLDGESLFESKLSFEAYALLMGNESKGLSKEVAAFCDQLLKIPMQGQAESLNVSVASGILMYILSNKKNDDRDSG